MPQSLECPERSALESRLDETLSKIFNLDRSNIMSILSQSKHPYSKVQLYLILELQTTFFPYSAID